MNRRLLFVILLLAIMCAAPIPIAWVTPAYALDTGLKYPANCAKGSSGDPPTNPGQALVDDVNTGTQNDALCAWFKSDNPPSHVTDSEIYTDFTFGVPTSAIIDGIEVYVSGYYTGNNPGTTFSVRLWDGATWTSYKTTSSLTKNTDAVYKLGGQAETWVGSWIGDDFSNLNFKLEIIPTGLTLTGEIWKLDSVSMIVYYHLTLASIAGVKFYDVNTNGINDDGIVIPGWRIELWNDGETSLLSTQYTDGQGKYKFAYLQPGTYVVKEVFPATGTWVQTEPWTHLAALKYTLTLSAGQEVTGKDFGNVCLGPGGGHTKGYWTNNNGENTFNGLVSAGKNPLGLLTSLNLRNLDGSNFDPASYEQLKTWLKSATATNMAYMLSAQLAAMELNVLAKDAGLLDPDGVGFVDGNALIYTPALISQSGVNAAGFITINSLMSLANNQLGANPNTPDGHPQRGLQELIKNALDDANNNLNFAQATPCTFDTPY